MGSCRRRHPVRLWRGSRLRDVKARERPCVISTLDFLPPLADKAIMDCPLGTMTRLGSLMIRRVEGVKRSSVEETLPRRLL